jgi:hypothetical protein
LWNRRDLKPATSCMQTGARPIEFTSKKKILFLEDLRLFYMCFNLHHLSSKAISAPVIITTAMFIAVFTESVFVLLKANVIQVVLTTKL